uniref:GLOBIN domain-containing protein n=1 Tax=Panagrellus redivivus TaxID=6233 RepID=A0A7E4VYS4_PANRE
MSRRMIMWLRGFVMLSSLRFLLNHKPIATWAALIQPQCDQFRKRYYEFILGFVHFNYKNVDIRNTTRKLFSGALFEFLDRLYPYANRDPASYDTSKYYASSIHDIHLSLLSLTLGFDYLSFTQDRWIGLAEAISFELWTITQMKRLSKSGFTKITKMTPLN